MPETTIETLAADFARRFEGATRDDGTKYRRVRTDDANEDLTALIMAAHDGGEVLPDDWRYQMIEDALDAIAEDGEDATLEPAIYTHELTGWLHSSADRFGYCDEVIEEHGKPEGMTQILQLGMAREQEEVLASVLSSLRKLVEAAEDSGE